RPPASPSPPKALKIGDRIFSRHTITTGDRSRIVMRLSGKNEIVMWERTVVTFGEELGGADLETGSLMLDLVSEPSRGGIPYEVRTPNALIRVRGRVIVSIDRGGDARVGVFSGARSTVGVFSGTASVTPTSPGSATISLAENQGISINNDVIG